MKDGDKLYCIKNYNEFEIGKYYSIDYCDQCAVHVTYILPGFITHVVFSKFHNKTCEHLRLSEDEWELDKCQLRLNYLKELQEDNGSTIITNCLGSANYLYDYFISEQEVRKQKICKLTQTK